MGDGSSAGAEFRGGRLGGGGGSGKAGQARGEAKVAAERPAQCCALLRAARQSSTRGQAARGCPVPPEQLFCSRSPRPRHAAGVWGCQARVAGGRGRPHRTFRGCPRSPPYLRGAARRALPALPSQRNAVVGETLLRNTARVRSGAHRSQSGSDRPEDRTERGDAPRGLPWPQPGPRIVIPVGARSGPAALAAALSRFLWRGRWQRPRREVERGRSGPPGPRLPSAPRLRHSALGSLKSPTALTRVMSKRRPRGSVGSGRTARWLRGPERVRAGSVVSSPGRCRGAGTCRRDRGGERGRGRSAGGRPAGMEPSLPGTGSLRGRSY